MDVYGTVMGSWVHFVVQITKSTTRQLYKKYDDLWMFRSVYKNNIIYIDIIMCGLTG